MLGVLNLGAPYLRSFWGRVMNTIIKNLTYPLSLLSVSSVLVISYAHGDDETRSPDAELDKVVISAHSFDQGKHEMAQPATLLTDDQLQRQSSNNLGDMLSSQVGVSNSSYGAAVGRPVIRGMSGARVKILQDGIDTLDASTVSPDHGVNVDLHSVKKIEVLRGPATLLYGSGAFGGVVNVVDDRIPTGQSIDDYGTEIKAQYDSVNQGKTVGVKHSGNQDQLHWQVSASHSRSDEYELPNLKSHDEEHHEDEAEEEHEEHEESESQDTLANSDVSYRNNVTLGTSYVMDSGYVGIAVSQSKSEYGLPGHVHSEEHEEGETEEEHEAHESDGARIKMRQQRVDLDSRFDQPIEHIDALKFRLGFNDYKHDEIEGGEIGTKFRRQGFEGRAEALLSPVANISQVVGMQLSQDTFKAIGEEAIVPETDTRVAGLFWLGKTQLNNWGLELGARIEQAQLTPDQPDAINSLCSNSAQDYDDKDYLTHSVSFGLVRDLALFSASESDWQLTASVTSAQRAPSTQELFSCGPHAATQTFDAGNADLDSEQAFNVELGVRKIRGDFTTAFTLYQNQVADYIYAQNSGTEVDGFGLYQFVQDDATFIGGEVELAYQVVNGITVSAMADSVRATLDKAENGNDELPRIPADRFGLGFELSTLALFSTQSDFLVFGEWQQTQKQKHTALNEESTNGYDLLSLGVSYQAVLAKNEYRIDLKANNLLDEEVREHTSFVKEQAPQAGRNISLGLAFSF